MLVVIFSPATIAAPLLDISVSSTKVELGKPVELFLRSSQTAISLDTIDLNPIKPAFHIKNSTETNISGEQQNKHITLYPRKTGLITIPGLYFIDTKSAPIDIKVTPAIDPKDNSQFDVNYSVSTLSPWKKQQVLVEFALTSLSSIIVLNTPEAYSEHSRILTLDKYTSKKKSDKHDKYLHTTGWVIFPTRDGNQKLELPPVQLIRDGVTTHRFYPPYLEFSIKALPIYIPATMPVGKLVFERNYYARPVSLLGTTYRTEFTLQTNGVMPGTIPDITSQLKSSHALSFYPATTATSTQKSSGGISTSNRYTVNYKPNQQGYNWLGNIKLNYFDPEKGVIKTLNFDAGNTFSIHTIVAIFILLLFITITYFLLRKTYRWLIRQWQCLSGYKQVLNKIPELDSAIAIKQKLMDIAKAENWPANLSVRQWQKIWLDNTRTPCPIDINLLETTLYANKDSDIEQVKLNLKLLCLTRWPLLRFFA